MTDLPLLHPENPPVVDDDNPDIHEREVEPFVEPEPPAPAPEPAPEPAPAGDGTTPQPEPAAAAPPAAELAPAANPQPDGDQPAPNEPFWYRRTIKGKDQRIKELERQLAERPGAQAPQPEPQAGEPGYLDPVVRQHLDQIATTNRLDVSERFSRLQHGAMVDEALDWVEQRPDIAQWAMNQSDPYEALVGHYKREKLASEIGDDPEAWRQRERDRLREELRAELAGQPQNRLQPAPNNPSPTPNPAPPAPRMPAPASLETSAPPKGEAAVWSGPTPLAAATKNSFR